MAPQLPIEVSHSLDASRHGHMVLSPKQPADHLDSTGLQHLTHPSTSELPGYEGLVWQDVTKDGLRIRPNGHMETGCWVWKNNHGWKVWNAEGDEFWLCKLCHGCSSPKKHWFKSRKSTTRVKQHMKKEHGINAEGLISQSSERNKKRKFSNCLNGYDNATTSDGIGAIPFDSFSFWKSFLQCIIAGNIALKEIDSGHLGRLVKSANPQARLPSLETACRWITKAYDRQLSIITGMLKSATARVSLSVRLGTRGNSARSLGVRAHFIDCDSKPTSMLVGLPRRRHGINASNATETVTAIVAEHNLGESLGYVVTYGPSSDGVRMSAPTFDQRVAAKDRWIQCSGQFLDLRARIVLFGSDVDSLERELVGTQDDEPQRMDVWRRRGPCGKLRNIVAYVKRYSRRAERFEDAQRRWFVRMAAAGEADVLQLMEYDGWGWESMDDSIERALRLRPALDDFILQEMRAPHATYRHEQDELQPFITHDHLTYHDWEVLGAYHEVLQRIREAKSILRGQAGSPFGAIWQVLPQFETLLDHLDKSRQRHFPHEDEQTTSPRLEGLPPKERASGSIAAQWRVKEVRSDTTSRSQNAAPPEDNRAAMAYELNIDRLTVEYQFRANVSASWQRARDYCETLNENMIYVAAVVLHPRIKWRYFKVKWSGCEDRLISCIDALTRHWRENYKDKAARSRSTSGEVVRDGEPRPEEWSDGEELDFDQFEQYQSEQADQSYESTDPPIEYWVKRRTTRPQLSAMALDIYSVPVTAGGPEAVFDWATRAWPPEEQHLDNDTKACLMCLRIWQRSGIVEIDEGLLE